MSTVLRIAAIGFLAAAFPLSAAAQLVVYEEDFESFDVGPLIEQSDFESEYPGRLSIIENGAIEGRSLFHTADEFVDAADQGFDLFSPTFLPVYGRLEADVRIIGSNFYSLVPVDADTGLLAASAVEGVFQYVGIAAGETARIAIEVDATGETRLFKNGDLVGEDVNIGELATGVPARISRFGLYMTEFNGPFGEGGVVIDNITVTAAPCPEDFNADGAVDAFDLSEMLARWGDCDQYYAPCPTDRNNDGAVNADDLSNLLAAWGPCD